MFQLFKKGGRRVGGLLLGIQIFLVFFIPVNVAHAQVLSNCQFGKGFTACMRSGGAISNGTDPFITGMRRVAAPVVTVAKALAHPLDTAQEAGMALLVFIAGLIFKLVGIFFAAMAYILDIAIKSTISSGTYKIDTIFIAWTAVRDLSNMFFIFVLLFIAIQTILGLAGGSAKRWLSHVIIAALLINFSLFLTGVVIDAGNILAMGFWEKMTVVQGANTDASVSMQLMQGLQLQTIGDPRDATGRPIEKTPEVQLYAYIGGSLIMLVAGYVFLAGAVMMVIRTVTLMILMIASPFAFLGFALPKGGNFANTWFTKLISNTFVAPAFLAMLYIDSLIINSKDLTDLSGAASSEKYGAALSGDPGSLPIIYHYVLVIILILASLTVANQVSSGAGSTGGTWAKKLIGYGSAAGFAGGAIVGRNTIGRAAAADLKNEKWVKEQEKLIQAGGMRGRLANLKLSTLQKAKKGSFDIRNAPMGGAGVVAGLNAAGIRTGTGTKKTFATHGGIGNKFASLTGEDIGTENEKALIATAKERFPNNPSAQKAWLEQRGVKLGAKDTEGRNKDVTKTLNKGINAKENKEAAETARKEHEKQSTDLKGRKTALEGLKQQEAADIAAGRQVTQELTDQITATTAEMKTIEDKMTAEAEKIGKAFRNMSGDDVAELMNKPEYRNSKVVQDNLSAKDDLAIEKSFKEGGYDGMILAPAAPGVEGEKEREIRTGVKTATLMIQNQGRNILANPDVSEDRKRGLRNRLKNGTAEYSVNFKQELATLVSDGKDAQGNYVAKTALTPDEQVKLKELRAMMDHEDVAALDTSLLLNQHVAKDNSPATIAAVNKRLKEKGGETDEAFVNAFRDVHLKYGSERTVESIVKNTGNKESILYDEDLKHKFTPAFMTKLKELKEVEEKEKQGTASMLPTSRTELESLNLTTEAKQGFTPNDLARMEEIKANAAGGPLSPADTIELNNLRIRQIQGDEKMRGARLKELFAKGVNRTQEEQNELNMLRNA